MEYYIERLKELIMEFNDILDLKKTQNFVYCIHFMENVNICDICVKKAEILLTYDETINTTISDIKTRLLLLTRIIYSRYNEHVIERNICKGINKSAILLYEEMVRSNLENPKIK